MQTQPKPYSIAYREPFAFGQAPWRDVRQPGQSLLQIVQSVPGLRPDFMTRGVVCVNGEPVPRQLWAYVKPKATSDVVPVAVTLHYPLQGGGGNSSGKSVIALVAAIAILVVATAITGGAAAIWTGFGEAGLFAAGSTSATLLAAGVTVGGALAISALTAPPTSSDPGSSGAANAENPDPASAQGNIINPGGAVPRVVGTRKTFPPYVCEPVVELVDADEYVEALMALNGPHQLEDLRIDGVSITDAQDVVYETREGWPDDTAIAMVTRQGRTITPNILMSQHNTKSDNIHLTDPSTPEVDLPIWHGVSTRNSPDEVWIHLLLPGGLANNGTNRISIPMRVRIRKRGTTAWTNLPEIHVAGDTVSQLRFAIILKWQATADPKETVPSDNGFWYAHINVPPQDPSAPPVTPSDRIWVADPYFNSGSGNPYYYNGVEAASAGINFNLFKNRAEFYLNPSVFPPGIYEVQMIRGCSYIPSTLTKTTYVYGATIFDFFWWQTPAAPQMLVSKAGYSDRMQVARVISIWNDYPVKKTGFALIAVRAKNRSIARLSTQASGYVRDWDGSGWNAWTTTSNPAPHYADVLSGDQQNFPLPVDLRDDTALVSWRNDCIVNDWTCDAIVDDMRTQDILTLLASCAYAKPYQSDVYGVTVDKDRSGEVPVQVFSRVNAANVKFDRGFILPPAGFAITYRDNADDDDRAQTTVLQRDSTIYTSGLLEQATYDGLVDLNKVRARAQFDLDQVNLRATFYSLDTDAESLVCRRGSLVGLQHDVLSMRAGDGHVMSKTLDANSPPNITGFVLDNAIQCTNELDMHGVADMHLVADMHDVGVKTGIALRRTDGSTSTYQLSNVTGETNVLTLSTPVPDQATIVGFADTGDEYGCLVVSGKLSSEYKRMLVQAIAPQAGTAGGSLKATLTLVDEAPSLIRGGGFAQLTAMDSITGLHAMGGVSDELESMS